LEVRDANATVALIEAAWQCSCTPRTDSVFDNGPSSKR
jgi:hypothetical protein